MNSFFLIACYMLFSFFGFCSHSKPLSESSSSSLSDENEYEIDPSLEEWPGHFPKIAVVRIGQNFYVDIDAILARLNEEKNANLFQIEHPKKPKHNRYENRERQKQEQRRLKSIPKNQFRDERNKSKWKQR